jgi:hypothetical protein
MVYTARDGPYNWRRDHRVKILDRYVWKELLVPFLIRLFVSTFLR